MEYRSLGASGLKVSALSYGSWVTFGQQIGDDTAADLMKTAYEGGINFFDNAEAYADGKSRAEIKEAVEEVGGPFGDPVHPASAASGRATPERSRRRRRMVGSGPALSYVLRGRAAVTTPDGEPQRIVSPIGSWNLSVGCYDVDRLPVRTDSSRPTDRHVDDTNGYASR